MELCLSINFAKMFLPKGLIIAIKQTNEPIVDKVADNSSDHLQSFFFSPSQFNLTAV